MGHDPYCTRCIMHVPESQRHCFWTCSQVQQVWRAICLLLSRIGIRQGYVTWGTVSWLLLPIGPHIFYEGEPTDPVYLLGTGTYYRGILSMIPDTVRDAIPQSRESIFSTIACITLWCIWKARCMHVLSLEPMDPTENLRIIWSELIHTLRSQWDASQGDSRAADQRRFHFLRTWGGLPSVLPHGQRLHGMALCCTTLASSPCLSSASSPCLSSASLIIYCCT